MSGQSLLYVQFVRYLSECIYNVISSKVKILKINTNLA